MNEIISFFKNTLDGFWYYVYLIIALFLIIKLLKYIINKLDASSNNEFLDSRKDVYQATNYTTKSKEQSDSILVIKEEKKEE